MKWLLVVLVLLMVAAPVSARWTGAQTVTFQWEDSKIVTVYTTVLERDLSPNRFVAFVVDAHPVKGIDGEVSITQFFQLFYSKLLYTTAGMRRGIWDSDTPCVPYISFTSPF